MNILFLSPNDWGGTQFLMAHGINSLTKHTAHSITETHHPFHYDTDIVMKDVKTMEQMQKVKDIIENADFFCIAQGIPKSIAAQVLKRTTLTNSFVRHSGSDIRNVANEIFYLQLTKDYRWTFTAYDFSMTRCLVQSLHHNTHIIDTERWKPKLQSKDENSPVVIYHSPTNQEIKGTKYITDAITKLSKKYNIVWTHTGCDSSGAGGQSWADVMAQKRNADIFIDSIEMFDHGQNAVEAMCFGIPVLNRLSNYYLSLYPDTPIINTDKTNIEENLEKLIVDHNLRRKIGIQTRKYCEETFSIERRIPMWTNIIEFIMNPTADLIYKTPQYWKRQETQHQQITLNQTTRKQEIN